MGQESSSFQVVAGAVAAMSGLVVLMRMFSSQVYDLVIIHMTQTWYKAVLDRVSKNSRVLDIGIGTASALLRNQNLVESKNLNFVGVDYDQKYVNSATKQVAQKGMENRVQVVCKSIFDGDLATTLRKVDKSGRSEDPYDAAYFSGSWTLMPSPVHALRIAASFVKDDGKVYVTQTFQRQQTPLIGFVKPLLKYITTIDFGQLHYETHLDQYIAEAAKASDGWKLEVEENIVVPGSIDNAYQAARLIVFKKTPAPASTK